jgi:ABC-type transport system substrate-binding protein
MGMKKILLIAITIVFLAATVFGMGKAEKSSGLQAAEQTAATSTAEPIQSAAVVDAETIRTDYLDVVNAYQPGTAGSSLKRAVAAMRVLDFCNTHHLADADREKLKENLITAWNTLQETEKGLFPELFTSVSEQIDEDLVNGASLTGLFEDAGIQEEMQRLLAQNDIEASWEALKSCTQAIAEQ